MKSKIVKRIGNKLTLEVQVDLDPNSMLSSEEQIQKALNDAGILATEVALNQFDTDGAPIEVDGIKMTSKGQQKKDTKPPMEKQ